MKIIMQYKNIGLTLFAVIAVSQFNSMANANSNLVKRSLVDSIVQHDSTLTKEELVDEVRSRLEKGRELVSNSNPEMLAQFDEASMNLMESIKQPEVTKEEIIQSEVKGLTLDQNCGENYIFGITKLYSGTLSSFLGPWNPALWGIIAIATVYDIVALPFELIGTVGSCLFSK